MENIRNRGAVSDMRQIVLRSHVVSISLYRSPPTPAKIRNPLYGRFHFLRRTVTVASELEAAQKISSFIEPAILAGTSPDRTILDGLTQKIPAIPCARSGFEASPKFIIRIPPDIATKLEEFLTGHLTSTMPAASLPTVASNGLISAPRTWRVDRRRLESHRQSPTLSKFLLRVQAKS
jgi:hypothetical protein